MKATKHTGTIRAELKISNYIPLQTPSSLFKTVKD